jgi:C_GCAxxG_C_C family probable redox protein
VDLIKAGFGEDQDYNCAEKILHGANQVYGLNLPKQTLKCAGGFGGGMAIEDKCGVLTAAIMVLGCLFIKDRAHESSRIKDLTRELFARFEKEMGSINCAPLKEKYRTPELNCRLVILKGAEILDSIVKRELSK